MPISAVIHLIPPKDVTLRPTMGHHAHAAFLSLLRTGNPEKAEEIHAASSQKPFTVSPLIGKGERRGNFLRIRAGTECWLRFTFLDDTLFAHFGSAFLTQSLPSIRLGDATFQLSRMVASGAETKDWSGNTTYEELIDAAGDRYADAGPIPFADRLSGTVASWAKNAQPGAYRPRALLSELGQQMERFRTDAD